MLFGGISCITAATVTHPIDTIKIRLQIQGEVGRAKAANRQYNNILRAAYLIL